MRGLVKLRVYLENPHDIENFENLTDSNGNPYRLKLKNPIKTDWVAEIETVTNRTHAELLRNTDLFVTRDDLPDLDSDEVYYHDLIKRPVKNKAGDVIGVIEDVNNFGASDVLLIKPIAGKDFFIPYSPVCVAEEHDDFIVIQNYEDFQS